MTTEREAFERDIFKPPHIARMLERTGEFTGRLCRQDKESFVLKAMDRFWDLRGEIKQSNDIERLWVSALRYVAFSRPKWMVWSWVLSKWCWVKPKNLRKRA